MKKEDFEASTGKSLHVYFLRFEPFGLKVATTEKVVVVPTGSRLQPCREGTKFQEVPGISPPLPPSPTHTHTGGDIDFALDVCLSVTNSCPVCNTSVVKRFSNT